MVVATAAPGRRCAPAAPGLRIIEIGCGPGAAARAVAEGVGGDPLREIVVPAPR